MPITPSVEQLRRSASGRIVGLLVHLADERADLRPRRTRGRCRGTAARLRSSVGQRRGGALAGIAASDAAVGHGRRPTVSWPSSLSLMIVSPAENVHACGDCLRASAMLTAASSPRRWLPIAGAVAAQSASPSRRSARRRRPQPASPPAAGAPASPPHRRLRAAPDAGRRRAGQAPAAAAAPVFRTGINFVRVDVVVTDNKGNAGHRSEARTTSRWSRTASRRRSRPSADQGRRATPLDGEPPRQIRTTYDEETERARDDVRLFVIFLDDYHVRRGASMAVARAADRLHPQRSSARSTWSA